MLAGIVLFLSLRVFRAASASGFRRTVAATHSCITTFADDTVATARIGGYRFISLVESFSTASASGFQWTVAADISVAVIHDRAKRSYQLEAARMVCNRFAVEKHPRAKTPRGVMTVSVTSHQLPVNGHITNY
jgi:hypothetical protein